MIELKGKDMKTFSYCLTVILLCLSCHAVKAQDLLPYQGWNNCGNLDNLSCIIVCNMRVINSYAGKEVFIFKQQIRVDFSEWWIFSSRNLVERIFSCKFPKKNKMVISEYV